MDGIGYTIIREEGTEEGIFLMNGGDSNLENSTSIKQTAISTIAAKMIQGIIIVNGNPIGQ